MPRDFGGENQVCCFISEFYFKKEKNDEWILSPYDDHRPLYLQPGHEYS